ncbi:uncharacterized protein RCO7_01231 [Rhynchosporium graminicola]|uniref:CFEM domain-containing protein n=1 Tax=Rhynchosporium graminicola TaxID=2792576 RepID=A0A1E1JQY5_9HELO|nr:uncharacterized protein RCO7_01231 [Rhynchosporium commune]
MQFSLALAFAILAALVASQSASSLVAQLPSCALTCLASASTSNACGVSDYACQCGAKRADITKSATPCVLSSCSTDDALKTNYLTGQICNAASAVQTSAANSGSVGSYASYFPSTEMATATGIPVPATTAPPTPTTTVSPTVVVTGAASRGNGDLFAAIAVAFAAFAL